MVVLALLSATFLLDWYAGSSCSMDDQTMLFSILSPNINEKTICALNVKSFICISFVCSVSVSLFRIRSLVAYNIKKRKKQNSINVAKNKIGSKYY